MMSGYVLQHNDLVEFMKNEIKLDFHKVEVNLNTNLDFFKNARIPLVKQAFSIIVAAVSKLEIDVKKHRSKKNVIGAPKSI